MFRMLKISDTLYIHTRFIKKVYYCVVDKHRVMIDVQTTDIIFSEHNTKEEALESLEKLIRMIDQ